MSNTNTTKPAAILQLEKELGIELVNGSILDEMELEDVENTDYDGAGIYYLDEKNKVIELDLMGLDLSDKNLCCLNKLKDLEILNLNSCNIKTLCELKLKKLCELTLVDNELENTNGLRYLHNLTHLDLSDNLITDISGLKELICLEFLTLYENYINNINELKFLVNLASLDLTLNHIEYFPPDFLINLPDLENLYLPLNPIQNLPKELFSQSKKCFK
jgi:Leucine-rich repeat (LRR) protein